jgi:hypothetical protein
MTLSYSSFKNNIVIFDKDEYLQNLNFSILNDVFLNFIKDYQEIENEDFKKPIFSQTTKFKKVPNNYKNYKYVKINRDKEEIKNIWTFENPLDENNKILITIKTYLNKISEETYIKISNDFIDELLNIKNIELFNILSSEIFNKCIFDNKYRHLYINLCHKIWSNKQIHYNLVNITNNNNLFYWEYKEKYGPFSSEINAKNDIYTKINYKKYFLNYIQNLYKLKDISFEDITEEEIFLKKRKILSLVEIIGLMYLEKYINFDIINIIIIDLLHINNFYKIEDIEYEILYNLIKLIKENKNSYHSLNEHKSIFKEYVNIMNNLIINVQLSKRSLFFINEVILMFELFNSNTNTNINTNINTNNNENLNNNKNIILDKIQNNFNINEILEIYVNNDKNYKVEIIYKIIYSYISKKNDNIVKFLNKINDKDLIYNSVNKIIDNIKDILLDIPNAIERLIILINNINNENYNLNNFIDILNNIKIDSDDSDDSNDSNNSDDSDDSDD